MLHPKTIARIRELLAEGQPPAVIAKMFAVLPSTVRKIAEAGEAALEPRPAAGDPGAHVESGEAAGDRPRRGVGSSHSSFIPHPFPWSSIVSTSVRKWWRRFRRLLAQGNLSQRAIAKQTGITRATVARIARVGATQPASGADQKSLPEEDWYRCSGCNFTVKVRPCRICAGRRRRAKGRRDRGRAGFDPATDSDQAGSDVPDLKLHGGALRRYRKLHLRKLADEPPDPDALAGIGLFSRVFSDGDEKPTAEARESAEENKD
jgi:hypothetical protein